MRYYLSIDGKEFGNVSSIIVNKSYRSEISNKNLGGDLLIDRVGNEKTDLTAKVNMLSDSDMAFLRQCRNKMSVTVKYYEGNALVEKSMYIKPFKEPAPIYFYGDRTKGLMFGSVSLTITEI